MIPSGLVVGYHGCDRELAESVVLCRTELESSRNDHDWLGHGIYFWQNDAHRAWAWAGAQAGKSNALMREPAVLGAVIDLRRCFNTAQMQFSAMLAEAYDGLSGELAAIHVELPVNSGRGWANRRLDCAVFEHMHRMQHRKGKEPFDTVVGYFPEGDSVYPGAAVRRFDHVQICVRNPSCIIGCFLARPADNVS